MQAGGQSNSTWGQARVRNRYKCNLARRIELIENRDLYTSPISTYATAPNANLSVTDFERYALARLKGIVVPDEGRASFSLQFII